MAACPPGYMGPLLRKSSLDVGLVSRHAFIVCPFISRHWKSSLLLGIAKGRVLGERLSSLPTLQLPHTTLLRLRHAVVL